MRRLLRWCFNFAATASALLFIGVCTLWYRSHHVADEFLLGHPLAGNFSRNETRVVLGPGWAFYERRLRYDPVGKPLSDFGFYGTHWAQEWRFRHSNLASAGPPRGTAPRNRLGFVSEDYRWLSSGNFTGDLGDDFASRNSGGGGFGSGGFGGGSGGFGGPTLVSEQRIRVVPFWPAACLTAIAPAELMRRRLRRWCRMRPRPGRCLACGYDLRATPEEGGALLDRCPECGRVPERKGAEG